MVKLKQLALVLGTAIILSASTNSFADPSPIYTQNFDGVTLGGPAAGITVINRSTLPTGVQWGGGNSNFFAAQSGAVGSYFADAYTSTGGPTGAVSDWLLTPTMSIANNYTFSFYARADVDTAITPDSLEVRLCTVSPCTNVGSSPTTLGAFTTLLLSVNETLAPAGFPTTWTQYTATVSGLGSGNVNGRFALRYVLPDVSTQGSYIGIDSIVVSAVPEPESVLLLAAGFSAMGVSLRRRTRK